MKFLTPIMFLALAAAIFFWIVNPIYKDIKVLGAEKTNYDAAITRATQAGQKRDSLVNKHNTFTDADLERLNKLLPVTSDNIRLIVDLNAIASKYTSEIGGIAVNEEAVTTSVVDPSLTPDQVSAYKPIFVTFSATMTYDNFLRFLTDIQKNLRLTDVVNVKFTADSSGSYDFSITLKTYVMR